MSLSLIDYSHLELSVVELLLVGGTLDHMLTRDKALLKGSLHNLPWILESA